jgi:hypothetical protein
MAGRGVEIRGRGDVKPPAIQEHVQCSAGVVLGTEQQHPLRGHVT